MEGGLVFGLGLVISAVCECAGEAGRTFTFGEFVRNSYFLVFYPGASPLFFEAISVFNLKILIRAGLICASGHCISLNANGA